MKSVAPKLQPTIIPLMFPSGNRQLMGVHYAPPKKSGHNIGVLMCNQVGPDYAEYYKTSRMLLSMLVARGFDCLRFDYTGCGDSEGDFQDDSVQQWLSDIATAKTILRERSDCSSVCICGFGLGGLLAATHAAVNNVAALILWEPVVDGQAYCCTLRKNHKQWLRGSFVKAQRVDKQFQKMGFPATDGLEREISRLRIADLSSCRAEKVFAVVRDNSRDQDILDEHFSHLGISIQSCASGESLPLRPMRTILAWLEGIAGNE